MYQEDWIGKWATYSPNKVAIKELESGRTLTYKQLHEVGKRLAWYFQEQVMGKAGDRVVVLAENCAAYVGLFSMAQQTGAVLVPLNYRLSTEEIDYLIEDAEPSWIIVEEKYADLISPKVRSATGVTLQSLGALEHYCYEENGAVGDISAPNYQENDPLFILYTSGTTGRPKGAIYSHKMLFWNSINTSLSLIINAESRTINCMPPFHTGGWNVLLTPFLHHGAFVGIVKKFEPEAILRYLEEEAVSIFMGVPTMLKMVSDLPVFSIAKLDSLLYMIVGGEPMPIPLIEKWHEKGVPIRQGYGMTEVGPNLTSLHHDDAIRKKGSIGRPNFYVQTRIVDQDGKDLPAGEAGELLLKGPMVTPGYWKNEKATKEAIKDGWFHTGDRVMRDEEGYLFVVDRVKNMFISGGENVYPAEVERVLLEHPAIREVAVVGVADPKWGEVGKAFVVFNEESTTTEQIVAFCLNKLAKFKIPKHYQFMEELPKNDTGKIDRKSLKNQA